MFLKQKFVQYWIRRVEVKFALGTIDEMKYDDRLKESQWDAI